MTVAPRLECNTYLYYDGVCMSLTVRLTPRTERALDALARRRGQTRSDVVREAIERYASAADREAREPGPYRQWADVIGAVRLGGRKPGRTTGELLRDFLNRKARARRPR